MIGLIGGIGGGKSRSPRSWRTRGAVVIDADAVGHELLNDPRVCSVRSSNGLGRACFRKKALEPELQPAIDRKALGAIVFADPRRGAIWKRFLHPRMRAWFGR